MPRYVAYDVSNLPRGFEIGRAETLEAASKVAADHLRKVFGARPYTVMSMPDIAEDGVDILAYAGLESCQIAINAIKAV